MGSGSVRWMSSVAWDAISPISTVLVSVDRPAAEEIRVFEQGMIRIGWIAMQRCSLSAGTGGGVTDSLGIGFHPASPPGKRAPRQPELLSDKKSAGWWMSESPERGSRGMPTVKLESPWMQKLPPGAMGIQLALSAS